MPYISIFNVDVWKLPFSYDIARRYAELQHHFYATANRIMIYKMLPTILILYQVVHLTPRQWIDTKILINCIDKFSNFGLGEPKHMLKAWIKR